MLLALLSWQRDDPDIDMAILRNVDSQRACRCL
jgi:hypothetical protein